MKKALSLLLLFCTAAMAYPQEFRLFTFADYYGRIEPEESYDNLRARLYAQPEFQASLFNDTVDLTASANLWYQPLGDEEFIDPENILREAYISMPLGNFDIALGQKFETFGFADVYSPLNVINGSDTTIYSLDDTTDGKRADGMVQIQYYPTFDDTIELIYVPFPRPNYENRDKVRMEDSDRQVVLDFDNDPYLLENPHSLFLRYYHFSANFDLQVVYAWYTDQTRGFDFDDVDGSGTILTGTAESVYSRNNLFGAGISTTLGNTVVSEDLALTLTEDGDGSDIGIRNSSITANTQFTRTILNGAFAQLNVVYQYILNYDEQDGVYDGALYSDVIDEMKDYHIQPREHIAFAIAHIHKFFLRERLYLGLNAGLLYPDVYLAPRVTFALSDRMAILTGADINTGEPSDNDLKRSNDYDNFFVRLKYEY